MDSNALNASSSIPYLGEILAMMTALMWATGIIFFKISGERVHPLALNLYKNLLAFILLIPTIMILQGDLFRAASPNTYIILLVSGAIGIGIADTLVFMCLNRLGAGLSAIVTCMYAPAVILISFFWLGERLTMIQGIGALLIISAVLTAVNKKGAGNLSTKDIVLGLTYGTLAMIVNGIGVVMVKRILEVSPLLWVTEVRLLGGILILLPLILMHPMRKKMIHSMFQRVGWQYTFLGSMFGTYFAMVLWLGGMKYTYASIASALNQTSGIFIFIMAAIFLKEPINFQRTIGIILGVGGGILVVFG